MAHENKSPKLPLWNGKRIAASEDVHDLERRSALYEFKHRMNRHDAEHRAHHEYKKDKHREAAAYHLAGLKAAQASGSHEDAHKHGMMYQLHLKELGMDPQGPVPSDVSAQMKKLDRFYKFKPHHGDGFLLADEGSPTPQDEMGKSESLEKGNLVQFPRHKIQGSMASRAANAHRPVSPPIAMPGAKTPEQHRAGQLEQAKGRIDQIFQTMASDPGMQAQARQRSAQAKAQQLQMGGQKFKPGDRVVCSHADHPEDPNDCSYPWAGTVSGYEPSMSQAGGEHTYTVEWQHAPGQTGQGIHGQSEIQFAPTNKSALLKYEPMAKGKLIPFPSQKVTPAVDQGKDSGITGSIGRLHGVKYTPPIPARNTYPPGTVGKDVYRPEKATPDEIANLMSTGKPKAQGSRDWKIPTHSYDPKNSGKWIDVSHYLVQEHGSRALDDEGDYQEVLHGLARHYNVHPDVIDQELKRHRSRSLDDNGDLGHVIVEMNRHLTRHFSKK